MIQIQNKQLVPPSRTRNYGIDLLRLVAMFYVIILHSLGKGGIIYNAAVDSPQYKLSWAMEMWAFCAVNIFGMISGYVGYSDKEKKYNYSNYITMWLQVVFYGVVISLVVYFIDAELFTKNVFKQMFFPVSNNLYWYFTAYTGLFFLIPFINSGIRNCSNDHLKKLFFVIIAIFSVYSTPSNLMNAGKGYCFLWLMILYVLGAIVKKCEIGKNMPVYKAFLGILICTLISWAWKMYGVEFLFFKAKVNNGIVQYYNVVTHTCAAIFHIILFSKLKFRPIWQKVIGFAAPGAFAVYLINLQTYLWIYLENKLKYLIDRPVSTLFLHVVAFSFCYVVLCVLIDFVRQKLFQLFRVKKIAEAVTNFAENKLQAICNRF